MVRKSLVFLSLCVWALSALTPAVSGAQKDASGGPARPQASHLQRGIAGFEQGFYEFLPRSRRAEAEAAFMAAIRELELALEAEPNNPQAHRALARIHSVRNNQLGAAAHYRRLTEIDPFDIDSYALAALALAEAGRFAEARLELEKAKGRTSDARALSLLDGYLGKLAEAEKQAGAGR
jgi:tetratricopeptide (TPR) repeat protein